MTIQNHLELIEIILGAAIFAVPVLVVLQRLFAGKGIGVRSIQFVAVATVVPAVVILAMQGLMQGETVAAILAGLVGYLLGNVSKFDDRESH